MAIEAVKDMQQKYGTDIFKDLDSIIVATVTSPYFFPTVAAHVAKHINFQ